MTRVQLEHLIRASGAIANTQDVIILGSQSILGQYPNLSLQTAYQQILVRSNEADILIPNHEEMADLIDGSIGELSAFHDTYGYYAQGVDRTTSILPQGWEERLFLVCNANTNYIRGHCLDIHDLMVAKLYAGRQKDIEFFLAAISLGLLSESILFERLKLTILPEERRLSIKCRIEAGFHHEQTTIG